MDPLLHLLATSGAMETSRETTQFAAGQASTVPLDAAAAHMGRAGWTAAEQPVEVRLRVLGRRRLISSSSPRALSLLAYSTTIRLSRGTSWAPRPRLSPPVLRAPTPIGHCRPRPPRRGIPHVAARRQRLELSSSPRPRQDSLSSLSKRCSRSGRLSGTAT